MSGRCLAKENLRQTICYRGTGTFAKSSGLVTMDFGLVDVAFLFGLMI